MQYGDCMCMAYRPVQGSEAITNAKVNYSGKQIPVTCLHKKIRLFDLIPHLSAFFMDTRGFVVQ